jgi:hypothetical protein
MVGRLVTATRPRNASTSSSAGTRALRTVFPAAEGQPEATILDAAAARVGERVHRTVGA